MDKTTQKRASWIPASGDLFLLASVVAWGVNFPIAKMVLGAMDPLVFSATRYLLASCILFSFLWISGKSIKINGKEALQLFGIGVLGITLFQGGWAFGLNLTSASKASILVATAPLFGGLLAGFKGEKTGMLGWGGAFLSLAGVVLIINNSISEITIGGGSLLGDLLIVGAAFIWALYTVVSGGMVLKRGPLLVTAWAMFFGALVLTLMDVPGLVNQDWRSISAEIWLAWGVTAILGAALAFVWYCAGISRLGVLRGMSYSFLIPVVAISTSILFFGETMSVIQIGGVVIVLAGVRLSRM
ncbi:MAG: DMT family transporter [Sneathiella sp.]